MYYCFSLVKIVIKMDQRIFYFYSNVVTNFYCFVIMHAAEISILSNFLKKFWCILDFYGFKNCYIEC